MNFSYEEINLMALYNTGSRERLIEVLTEMKTYLTLSETELRDLTDGTLDKLAGMRQRKKTASGSAISSRTLPPGREQQGANPIHPSSSMTPTSRQQPDFRSCALNPITARTCRQPV